MLKWNNTMWNFASIFDLMNFQDGKFCG